MKTLPVILVAASAVLLCSCVDPYYAGDSHPRGDGPRISRREPVLVERHHRYVEERPPVMVDRYPATTYREPRPYYGDPVPSSTYRRTTTRTYQDY